MNHPVPCVPGSRSDPPRKRDVALAAAAWPARTWPAGGFPPGERAVMTVASGRSRPEPCRLAWGPTSARAAQPCRAPSREGTWHFPPGPAPAPALSGKQARRSPAAGWRARRPGSPGFPRRLASPPSCHPIGRHDNVASIGNADCALARDLMTPRRPAMWPGVGLRPIRLGGSSAPGGVSGCPGLFTGPGHPGGGGRPQRGRMTCTA